VSKSFVIRLSVVVRFAALFLLLFASPLAAAQPEKSDFAAVGKDESVAHYERKSISYLRMLRTRGVSDDAYRILESAIRRNIELPRFDYNDIGHIDRLTPQDAAEAVQAYLDEIKLDRAREQAEFDFRFKDYSITAADLRRIADSAYLYQPHITSFVHERERYVVVVNGVRQVRRRWVARVSVAVRFYSVDFDRGRAEHMTTLRASGRGSVQVGFQGDDAARREAVASAAQSIGRELEKQVRAVDAFRLLTPIRAADLNSVTFELTRNEGLKLDQGFYVYDFFTDGSRKRAGYVRVRRVGDGEKRLDSAARNITVRQGWSFDEGQLLEEHPQKGLGFKLEARLQRLAVDPVPELQLPAAEHGAKLALEAQYHIAPLVGVSELYAVLGGHWLAASMMELGLEVGLDKRFFLRRLVMVPGIRLGGLRTYWHFAGLTGADAARTFRGDSLGVTPRMGFEFFLTPEFSLSAGVGYRLYSPQTVLSYEDGASESGSSYRDFGSRYDFRYNPSGWDAGAGVMFSF
jgi:hypothetical protein